jgi:hypothetical protein
MHGYPSKLFDRAVGLGLLRLRDGTSRCNTSSHTELTSTVPVAAFTVGCGSSKAGRVVAPEPLNTAAPTAWNASKAAPPTDAPSTTEEKSKALDVAPSITVKTSVKTSCDRIREASAKSTDSRDSGHASQGEEHVITAPVLTAAPAAVIPVSLLFASHHVVCMHCDSRTLAQTHAS